MRRGRNLEGAREESWRHLWKNCGLHKTELAEVSKLGEIQMDQKNSSFRVSWNTDFRIGRKISKNQNTSCVKDFLIHWHILNLQYHLLSSYWMPGLFPRCYKHWVEQMDKHYASHTCGKQTIHKVSNWKRKGVLIVLRMAEKVTQGREADVWSSLGWWY